MIKHVLRNCIAPIMVFTVTLVADAIIFEASLTFIGAGIQEPTATWGKKGRQNRGQGDQHQHDGGNLRRQRHLLPATELEPLGGSFLELLGLLLSNLYGSPGSRQWIYLRYRR